VQNHDVTRVRDQAVSLIVDEGRCIGVSTRGGRTVLGRAVLMATGGGGGLWASTTNAPGATADGTVLAVVHGVEVADLEFMQFHPTALSTPGAQQVLLTEALRGDGALLVNEHAERFVDELAPRHVVAKAILDQRRAFLDCRTVERLEERFPTVVEAARAHGFDPASEPLPVRPAAHYFIGGIASDAQGTTSMPGLFAAGECASTGMHGANRMAGNSLLEAVVVGRRIAPRALACDEPPREWARWTRNDRTVGDPDPAIPAVMWECAGPIRDHDRLKRGAEALNALPASPHRTLATMIVRAATQREETRGVHIRSDYPDAEQRYARRAFATAP
jgi:L-aspartate oxidase